MDDKIWYYVDRAGTSVGPLKLNALKPLYGNEINDDSFIWNGTTVANWTALDKLPDVWTRLKPEEKPRHNSSGLPKMPDEAPPKEAPSSSPPASTFKSWKKRKSPFGGGGMLCSLYSLHHRERANYVFIESLDPLLFVQGELLFWRESKTERTCSSKRHRNRWKRRVQLSVALVVEWEGLHQKDR